jgi:predicted phage tail protein
MEYRGSGGKGGGTPDVADISGISNDRAEIVLGLCEGQIEGLGANPARNIFLDNTPIENQDGSRNFEGIDFAVLAGGLNQSSLPGSSGSEISTPTNVNVTVVQSTPVTRAINNPEINSIRIRVAVRLQKQEDDGDVKGESVQVKIFLKEGSGAFVLRVDQTIKGRFPDLTVFPYLLAVNPDVADYTIRIEKVGADSTSRISRDLQWLTYEEVVQAQLTYPNTCVIWIQYPPKLFRSAPTVTIKLSGWLAQLPVTATIAADRGLNFTGVAWNGTFYRAGQANTDPAWLLWGYLTDKIWGLGIEPQYIDRYAFYQASVYNNQLIPDGFGGTERRFSFRGQMVVGGDKGDRYQTAREIAATFTAKIYHNGQQYTIWQDRPTIAQPRIVSNADVVDGVFLGTTQDYSAIATACYVWRSDPDQEFQETPEPVEYPSAINRFGYKLEEFRPIGETRRGGAVRAGRRVILSSLPSASNGEIGQISFKVRAVGLFFELGDIVQIADSGQNSDRKSGLIKSATASAITLDAATTVGNSALIYATLPNMATEFRTVINSLGSHSIINVSVPFSQIPAAQSTWQIVDSNAIVRKYRVINVSPDTDNQNLHEVVGKLYQESLYNEIENGWLLTAYDQQEKAPVTISPPRNVSGEGLTLVLGSSTALTLSVTWDFPIKSNGDRESYVQSYAAEFKRGIDGDWGSRQTITAFNARWENIGAGTFYARVAAIAIDGRFSSWAESSAVTLTTIATANNSAWLLAFMMQEEDFN